MSHLSGFRLSFSGPPFNSRAKRSSSPTSPAACANAPNAGPNVARSVAGIRFMTAAMAERRCSITVSTSSVPCWLSARRRYLLSAGLSRRSSRPAVTSRSQALVAFEGCTPKSAATAPRFCGPCVAIKTSMRNCVEVTRCSTSATDWAMTAKNTRAARIAASMSSIPSAGISAVFGSSPAGPWVFKVFTPKSIHPLLANSQSLRQFIFFPAQDHLGMDRPVIPTRKDRASGEIRTHHEESIPSTHACPGH